MLGFLETLQSHSTPYKLLFLKLHLLRILFSLHVCLLDHHLQLSVRHSNNRMIQHTDIGADPFSIISCPLSMALFNLSLINWFYTHYKSQTEGTLASSFRFSAPKLGRPKSRWTRLVLPSRAFFWFCFRVLRISIFFYKSPVFSKTNVMRVP